MKDPVKHSDAHKATRKEVMRTGMFAVAGLAALLAVLSFAYGSLEDLDRQNASVRHSWKILKETESFIANIKDAENGCRGFLLTNDSSYLLNYERAVDALDHDLEVLMGLMPDSAREHSETDLKLQSERLLHSLEVLVDDQASGRAEVGRPNAANLMFSRKQMERLRALYILTVTRNELALMRGSEKERSLAAVTPMMFLAFAVLAITGLSLLFYRTLRTLHRARKAESEAVDFAAQRDREARTRELAERRLQRVVDSTRSGIISLRCVRDDRGGIVDFRIVLVNAIAAGLLGKPGAELAACSLLSTIPGLRDSGLFALWSDVVEGDSSSSSELEIDLGTGARWHDFRATRLLDGLVVNVRDLTARRQEEAHRIKDRGLGGVGRFARVLAHEVRNPLTNIHLALEQLKVELPEDVEESTKAYTGILQRNAERIEQHITQLLHASRSLDVELRPNGIAGVLTDAIEQVKDRSRLLGIKLEVDLPDDLPEVNIDPETLTIALVNLCVNAMEAMEEGKGRLLVRAHATGDHVVVELADNGKGMSYEQQERIFQPFFSDRSGGMGLGLTEARNILEAHNAGVSVKSREGGGTTFLLAFRSASAPANA